MNVKFESYLVNAYYNNETGNKAVGKKITIYKTGTTELAALFDKAGFAVLNPVTTDEYGKYSFYIQIGDYDFIVDAGTELEYALFTDKNIGIGGSGDTEESFVLEIPPFDGNVIATDKTLNTVAVEVDGRTLPPSYYSFLVGGSDITLNNAVTVENKVVVRGGAGPSSESPEEDYIKPERYGAKGGSNDDTIAFGLALQEQRKTGKPILLTKPVYTADINPQQLDYLVIFSNVNFTTVKTLNYLAWTNLNLVHIQNVTFDFSNAPTGSNGIGIIDAKEVYLKDSIFKNAKRTNVALNNCSNFIIDGCQFNGAGQDKYTTPGGVTIGCGLILESCKNDGLHPTVVKDCIALRPYQIGFFVYNSNNTTESYGNVIDGCMVFGAKDNGIRTQTQGTPFDPLRCRDHIITNCYVSGSAIDNYRVNGGNNTYVHNTSYAATGYGFKSDGGSNNIINNNHDNGSSVAVGLRIGADTINYSMSGNTSLNCKGSGAAIYGVAVDDNLTVSGINCSNNTVMSIDNANCSPYAFVVSSGNPLTRFKQLSVSNNYSSASEKQSLDVGQADSPFVSCNAFFASCNAVNNPVLTFSGTSDGFGVGNFLQGKSDGTTSFAVEFKSGSNNNKFASNYMMNFSYDPAVNDFDTNNQVNQGFTDYNNDVSTYTVANASSLGPRLTRNINVSTVAGRATGQEAALDVLGFVVTYLSEKEDGRLGRYTHYENV